MPSAPDPLPAPWPIVFFDGTCGVCNRFVSLLLRLDRRRVLSFAPLQGETARANLGATLQTGMETVVLRDGAGRHERSEAVLRILEHLGGLWRVLAGAARLVPGRWRDAAYDAFAARRYRWFGRREACPLPPPAERERFLP